MKQFFQILHFFVLSFLCYFFASCSDDDPSRYSFDDPTIYSTSDKILFSEIILFISPYVEDVNGQKNYIVMDTLQNLSIKLNGRILNLIDSYQVDTVHLRNKKTIEGYRTTTDKISYPFAVNIRITKDNLSMAGEYADLLHRYTTLNPGTYVCQIISFDVKNSDGLQQKTVHTPTLIVPLKIEENQVSTSLGEFEVLVN